MTGTLEDPHASSRSSVELAREWADWKESYRLSPLPDDVQTLARALLAAEADFEAILRECERANDVRVGRVRISGNIYLIVQQALSALRGSDTA